MLQKILKHDDVGSILLSAACLHMALLIISIIIIISSSRTVGRLRRRHVIS